MNPENRRLTVGFKLGGVGTIVHLRHVPNIMNLVAYIKQYDYQTGTGLWMLVIVR